jgi:hypothetical protein
MGSVDVERPSGTPTTSGCDAERVGEAYDREILEARAGRHPFVSTKAAAWYLKMHPTTLSRLISRGVGPPSIVRDATRGPNAKKFYRLSDLDEWLELRNARAWIERANLTELDQLVSEERRLRAQQRVSVARARAAKLSKK